MFENLLRWRKNQANEPLENLKQSQDLSDAHRDNERMSMLWGPIGKDAYPAYAQEKIHAKYGAPEQSKAATEREQMFKNYAELSEAIKGAESADVIGFIRGYLMEKFPFAKKQFTELPEWGLGIHLKEIEEFSGKFVLKPDGTSRFPWMSDKQAWLFAHAIAPLHDMLKFLGSMDAQVMPDHEVMVGKLIRETFIGKEVSFEGRTEALDASDVEFIAGVVEDHENIEKEEGRDGFIHSSSAIEKAKATFFIADGLTGVLVPTETDGEFTIDKEQLRERFSDLYFRYIDLEKGKIFRPEWGVYALKDITTTLGEMIRQGQLTMREKNYLDILFDAAEEGIARAEEADTTNTKKLNEEQRARIGKARVGLQQLKAAA